MATKKEQYELAMAQSYLVDVLNSKDFSDEVMEKSRTMLKNLQDNYSFREDDFYHPRIAREEEIRSAVKKLQMAGERENVDYYLMLKDAPEYTLEQQAAADLLYGIHFNEEAGLTKRQFYLMAKYVSVEHELSEMAAGRIEGRNVLYDYMEEADNIIDELNTSSTKELYQEHEFDEERAEHADIIEEMMSMGGHYQYYRSNSWYEPDEEDYDEEKYETARRFLTLDWELSNTFNDNINHMLEKAPMLSDKYYAMKLVDAMETLDDKKFLVPMPIDKNLAKAIWDNYRNDELPPKERQAYFSLIAEANKAMNVLFSKNTDYSVTASDKDKINEMVDSAMRLCFYYKFNTKFEVTDDKVTIFWDDKEKIISDNSPKIELEYDGTMQGLLNTCRKFKKEQGRHFLRRSKYDFIEQMERRLNSAVEEVKYLPDMLYTMQKLANVYVETGGEKVVPSVAKEMDIISKTNMDDVLNGKDTTEFWKKTTTYGLFRMIETINYRLMKYGNTYGDELYKRPVAARRVLEAYQVLNGVQTKNLTPDYKNGNSNTLKK